MHAWGGKFAKSREPRLFPVPHTWLCATGTVRKASFPLAAPSHPPTLQSRLGKCWNETGIWMLTQRYQHVFCPGCFNSCFSSYSRISANEVSGSQTHPLAQRGVMKSRTQQFKTFLIPNQSPESLGAKDTTEEWAQFKTNLEFIINLGWFNLVALSLFRSWTLWGESFIFHWRGKVCYVSDVQRSLFTLVWQTPGLCTPKRKLVLRVGHGKWFTKSQWASCAPLYLCIKWMWQNMKFMPSTLSIPPPPHLFSASVTCHVRLLLC